VGAQRQGVAAIRRLARDEAQARPLCLAAADAVLHAMASFPHDVPLQRLAAAALGSLAYTPEVAALLVDQALPVLLGGMVRHTGDGRLQSLGSETLACFAQVGTQTVMDRIVQTLLEHEGHEAMHVCCGSLLRLWESGIGSPAHMLDTLLQKTESQPERFELQQRASNALQWLVHKGAIDEAIVKMKAASLDVQWVRLLMRFEAAGHETQRLARRFHADLHAVFHEEVSTRFEYEAAVRCLEALRQGLNGSERLREVIHALVENLEDYQGRLKVRELAWDVALGQLAPLDAALSRRLLDGAVSCTERCLGGALAAAAAEGPGGQELLEQRAAKLRMDCEVLLRRKTEMTQAHQEQVNGLMPEVILFEALDFLERSGRGASAPQLRAAERMFGEAQRAAPPEAVEQLQRRLAHLRRR